MKKVMITLIFIFILVACTNENIDKKHLAYVEDFEWTIKSFISSEQVTIREMMPETREAHKVANITFLESFIGKELTKTSYQLNEIDLGGEHVKAYIYEYEGEIVGAKGGTSAFPGMFNLADKSVLVESEEMKRMKKELYGE